jgi:hypothetical protein
MVNGRSGENRHSPSALRESRFSVSNSEFRSDPAIGVKRS